MKAYHIYLLRHGLTQANSDGRYVGRTDVPLSAPGEEQIAGMARQFDYPYADVFFSSPLRRCTQTLELLYPGAVPQLVPALAECDFGDFEGKTLDELKDDVSYKEWIAKKGMIAPPHGESSPDFQKRCCDAFEGIVDSLLRTGQRNAVIMAHGGTLMFILGTYGYPNKPFYEWLSGNGMGYEVVITPQLWMSAKAMDIAARIPEEAQGDSLYGLKKIYEDNMDNMDTADTVDTLETEDRQ
jgi:alpha-ribazole phosphatase